MRIKSDAPPRLLTVSKSEGRKIAAGGASPAKSQSDLFDALFARKSTTVRQEPVSFAFCAGDMVEHKKFGRGMILSVTPAGNDVKLEIMFDDVGTKSLMGSFAKLKKAQ